MLDYIEEALVIPTFVNEGESVKAAINIVGAKSEAEEYDQMPDAGKCAFWRSLCQKGIVMTPIDDGKVLLQKIYSPLDERIIFIEGSTHECDNEDQAIKFLMNYIEWNYEDHLKAEESAKSKTAVEFNIELVYEKDCRVLSDIVGSIIMMEQSEECYNECRNRSSIIAQEWFQKNHPDAEFANIKHQIKLRVVKK